MPFMIRSGVFTAVAILPRNLDSEKFIRLLINGREKQMEKNCRSDNN